MKWWWYTFRWAPLFLSVEGWEMMTIEWVSLESVYSNHVMNNQRQEGSITRNSNDDMMSSSIYVWSVLNKKIIHYESSHNMTQDEVNSIIGIWLWWYWMKGKYTFSPFVASIAGWKLDFGERKSSRSSTCCYDFPWDRLPFVDSDGTVE